MTENLAGRGEGLAGLAEAIKLAISAGADLRYDEYGVMEMPIGHLATKWDIAQAELQRILAALEAAAPASTAPEGGFVTGFERVLSERDGLKAALTSGLELVKGAFAHVSHGGPTRADAEKWIAVAREALGERI